MCIASSNKTLSYVSPHSQNRPATGQLSLAGTCRHASGKVPFDSQWCAVRECRRFRATFLVNGGLDAIVRKERKQILQIFVVRNGIIHGISGIYAFWYRTRRDGRRRPRGWRWTWIAATTVARKYLRLHFVYATSRCLRHAAAIRTSVSAAVTSAQIVGIAKRIAWDADGLAVKRSASRGDTRELFGDGVRWRGGFCRTRFYVRQRGGSARAACGANNRRSNEQASYGVSECANDSILSRKRKLVAGHSLRRSAA